MPEWLAFIIELFRSGQGLPFLAVLVVGILFIYLCGLIVTMLLPLFRGNRNSH